MDKIKLLDSDSSDDEDNNLKINNAYAERYENWRKAEEYQRLKDKYGDQNVLSESSGLETDSDDDSTDTEDSVGHLNEEIFDEKFLKVYSALKRNDPKIYDNNFRYLDGTGTSKESNSGQESDFDETGSSEDDTDKDANKKKDQKKMNLIDYHKKLLKEKKGVTEEDNDQSDKNIKDKSYYEQLDEIKGQFKKVIDDESSDSDDDLIKVVHKQDENEVADERDPLASKDEDVQKLKDYWTKDETKLDDNEKFLRDYILNKKYIDEDAKFKKRFVDEMRVKNRKEDAKDDSDGDKGTNEPTIVSSAKFHYQESDGDQIKRFPRIIDSARDTIKDSKRGSKRAEAKERKKKEKEEEILRFTEMKKEELKKKLNKLASISGNESFIKNNASDNDLQLELLVDDDKDFNPENYDKIMAKLFSNNYYDDSKHPVAKKDKNEKPTFEFIPGIDDEIEEEINNGPRALEEPASDDQSDENEPSTSRKRRGKKKRRRKVKAVDIDKIPLYEDVIGGDLPTRFKYRSVASNDYGLDMDELILAEDKELNRWMSLKHAVGYREQDEENADVKKFQARKNDILFKAKILKSVFDPDKKDDLPDKLDSVGQDNEDEDGEQVSVPTNKKKRKRRKGAKNVLDADGDDPTTVTEDTDKNGGEKDADQDDQDATADQDKKTSNNKRKRRRNKPSRQSAKSSNELVDVSRLEAYGLSKTEMKRRKLI